MLWLEREKRKIDWMRSLANMPGKLANGRYVVLIVRIASNVGIKLTKRFNYTTIGA